MIPFKGSLRAAVAAAAIVLCDGAAGAAQPPQEIRPPDIRSERAVSVEGRVRDVLTGVPIAGAAIAIIPRTVTYSPNGAATLSSLPLAAPASRSVISDHDGRFTIELLVRRDTAFIAAVAQMPGYDDALNALVPVGEDAAESISFELLKRDLNAADIERVQSLHEERREVSQQLEQQRQDDPVRPEPERPSTGAAHDATARSKVASLSAYSVPDRVWVSNLAGYTGYMDLDELVAGTVTAEMGDSFPFQSLKAQAVAARSYALERYISRGYANGGQVYTSNYGLKSKAAAFNTSKIVLLYGGNVISAAYSARCNGDATLNSENGLSDIYGCNVGGLYNGNVIPYLRSRTCSGHINCGSTSEQCCVRYVEGRWQYIYGHGVGLCQRGAGQFAGSGGNEWPTILHGFYTSVTVANGPGMAPGTNVVVTTNGVNVRSSACGTATGTSSAGTPGTLLEGPVTQYCTLMAGTSYLTWWKVSFNSQPGVWIVEDYLQRTSSPPSQPPTVTTGSATNVSRSGATLNGTVNPNAASATTAFDYGTTPSYGTTVSAQTLTGTNIQSISAAVSALACNTLYYYRATATSSAGTAYGAQQTFTTSPCSTLPEIGSTYASSIAQSSATLNTTVNPNGSDTWVNFTYDNNTRSTPVVYIGSGNSGIQVSQDVSGLACGTEYSFRVTASNAAGTIQNIHSYFSTSPCPPIPPAIDVPFASNVNQTTATLNVYVNPNGSPTYVNYHYDNATKLTPVVEIGSGTAPVLVAQTVSGLTCNTHYTYRAQASNNAGTFQSTLQSFTTTSCPSDGGFHVITPCRLIDTREQSGVQGGPILSADTTRNVVASGRCGIPPGVKALSVNLVAVSPATTGFLTLFPGPAGAAPPPIGTLSYRATKTLANNAMIMTGSEGSVNVYNSGPAAIHFILDVNGYFK